MLIDVLSPRDLTTYATGNVDGLIGFLGFVILIGTIIGIIIDGIHHSIIEGNIFESFIGVREIREFLGALYPQTDIKIWRSYFFKVERALEIDEYMESKTYRYSEFYSNTFIALIPFSFVTPFYLYYVFQISWSYSIMLGLTTFFVACISLRESYTTYKNYFIWVISALCGYLDYCSYLHVKPLTPLIKYGDSKFEAEIRATLIDKISQKPVFKGGIDVNFKTTLGNFKTNSGEIPQTTSTTDAYGETKCSLILDQDCLNNGIAIVTATSKKCIPGLSQVPKDKRVCIRPFIYLKKKFLLNYYKYYINNCHCGRFWRNIWFKFLGFCYNLFSWHIRRNSYMLFNKRLFGR